ncbi:MAG: hypothetical protein R3266_06895 [Gemmatimonadota bacterium]|nr:hypothetical protein [Gemmatimonadota bacterium]
MARGRSAVWSALLASLATLVCCALPSLLVLLGLGTSVAAAVSAAPWLVTLSRNKDWVFLGAGLLIVGSRLYIRHVAPRIAAGGSACPVPLSRLTRLAWWISVAVFSVALLIAYLLGPLLARLEA